MYPGRSGRDGFTLIELIVVLALISLVATLSIPHFQSFILTDSLKTTTRKLIGIVSEFSQEAVRANTGRILIFDLTQNLIQSDSQFDHADTQFDSEKEKSKTWLALPDVVRIVDISSVHGGKQSQGQVSLYFSKKGYIDKTYIHLRDEDGGEMTVMLSPFLGVIRVADSYLELSDEEIF